MAATNKKTEARKEPKINITHPGIPGGKLSDAEVQWILENNSNYAHCTPEEIRKMAAEVVDHDVLAVAEAEPEEPTPLASAKQALIEVLASPDATPEQVEAASNAVKAELVAAEKAAEEAKAAAEKETTEQSSDTQPASPPANKKANNK